MNLNKILRQDDDLNYVDQFTNLRKLNLSFTPISGAALKELVKLKELKIIALSGTNIRATDLQVLASLPNLTQVYLWNTSLQPQDIAKIRSVLKSANIEMGYTGDTVTIKLNAPQIENDQTIFEESVRLKVKHPIKGVVIHYTTDGSEPDSINAAVYKNDMVFDKNIIIKAKAYKKGWISSDVASKSFYKRGFVSDSIGLLHPPDPQFKGEGANVLSDGQKGDVNFRDGSWLGYKDKPLQLLYHFEKAATVSSVMVSSLVDVGSYVMPPQEIEVWSGSHPSAMRLLKRITPQQPLKEKPVYMLGYEVNFAAEKANYFKVVVQAVKKLPSWHRGKGEKAWVFADEILIN